MKFKLFIITYKNSKDLCNNLNSLFSSNIKEHQLEINIINNHSNFNIDNIFQDKITIFHNKLRPDFSTGWLAENWNQAIINGFKDLNTPDCDILITAQDDTIWEPDWLNCLLELHQDFDFIQMGVGDHVCSYKPEAIKKIGLWDQRYPGIGFQESDYFLRALIYNKDKTCLNDYQHGRLINNVNFSICQRPAPNNVFSDDHRKSMNYHYISEKVFKTKWPNVPPNYWTQELINNPPTHSAIPSFIYYPYFELNCYNLLEKGYII